MRVPCFRISFIGLLLTGAAAFPPSAARGGAPDNDAEPLLAAASTALADGRLGQSRVLGFTLGKQQFSEAPKGGGVLIGLDIGLGKFFNIENIYAVRAVYLTRQGEVRTEEHGLFHDKWLPNGRRIKTKVLRTVHAKAPPGYAVGGLTIRSGLNINGLCITFMKIDGNALDPRQARASAWVGDRTGGGESSIDGNGAAVVGLCGSQDNEKVTALGLICATLPAVALAPAVAHPANLPPNPPAHATIPPPPATIPPPPAAEPLQPNIANEAPQAAAPPRSDPVSAEPTTTANKTVVAPAVESWPLWATAGIPAAVFVFVAVLCLLAVLNPFGRRAPQVQSAAERPAGARPKKTAAVSPSALCEEPRQAPRKRPAFDKEEVIDLREEDVLPALPAANELILEPLLIRKAGATASPPASSRRGLEV